MKQTSVTRRRQNTAEQVEHNGKKQHDQNKANGNMKNAGKNEHIRNETKYDKKYAKGKRNKVIRRRRKRIRKKAT